MGKTVTITKKEFQELATQTGTEIMIEHSGDAPQAAFLFSVSCMAFAAMLAKKLFPEDEDNE